MSKIPIKLPRFPSILDQGICASPPPTRTTPDKVAEAAALAKAVVERFAAEGPRDEEMDTVRKQLQNNLETMYKEPRYWVDLLSDLEYHGTKLVDLEGMIAKFLALSKDEVAAEMRKTVVPERFAMVLARPKAPSAAEERRSTN